LSSSCHANCAIPSFSLCHSSYILQINRLDMLHNLNIPEKTHQNGYKTSVFPKNWGIYCCLQTGFEVMQQV
jgi:hypothetical protein